MPDAATFVSRIYIEHLAYSGPLFDETITHLNRVIHCSYLGSFFGGGADIWVLFPLVAFQSE